MHLRALVEWKDGALKLNIVNILTSHVLSVVLRNLLELLLLDILSHHLLVLGTNFTIPVLYWLVLNEAPFNERILVSEVAISAWKIRVIVWFLGYRVTDVAIHWLRVHFSSVSVVLCYLHVSSWIAIFVNLVILIHLSIIIYYLLFI